MEKVRYVRVRPYHLGGPCAVRHPDFGEFVVPNPAEAYRADDPLVIAYPWLFVADEDLDERGQRPYVTEVRIEDATARPGARRGGRR